MVPSNASLVGRSNQLNCFLTRKTPLARYLWGIALGGPPVTLALSTRVLSLAGSIEAISIERPSTSRKTLRRIIQPRLTKFGEPINPVLAATSAFPRDAKSGINLVRNPQVRGLPYRLTNPTNCYAMQSTDFSDFRPSSSGLTLDLLPNHQTGNAGCFKPACALGCFQRCFNRFNGHRLASFQPSTATACASQRKPFSFSAF